MGGMELSVVTMASDLGRSDDAELALKSVDKAIVALSDEVDYWAPLVNAAKIRKYAKTRNLQELQPSTRQIVESKMREAAYNERGRYPFERGRAPCTLRGRRPHC